VGGLAYDRRMLAPLPRLRLPLVAAAAALLCAALLAGCSGEGDDAATDPETGDSEPQSTTECSYPEDGGEAPEGIDAPDEEAPDTGEVAAVIATNSGDVNVTLDRAATPCTVNSFVSLAEQGYFDGTQCHRITTQGIFVLQCGDPTATGMGGPGYKFDDELTGDETYPAGTLAMANAGPGTNGSQFFIVYDDTQLDPNYTVFGEVGAAGLEVVQGIAAKGAADGAPDGPPAEQVDIESVTIG
jgi:peptidyl-prolyl cis-trans isomerase B (cyclophilin B)